jgi:hypothetical protein
VLAIGFTWAFDQLERFYIKNERSVSGANPLDLSPDAHQGPLIVGVLITQSVVERTIRKAAASWPAI